MDKYCRCALAGVAVALLAGCGYIDSYLTLQYKPLETPVDVMRRKCVLSVNVIDTRENPELVGAHCGDMSHYFARDSVAGYVRNALDAELLRRGYSFGEGNALVKIDLTEFFYSTCGHNHEARVTLEVQVFEKDGVSVYKNTVRGGKSSQPTLWSGVSARGTLEQAFSNAVARLFADQSFHAAMLKSSCD